MPIFSRREREKKGFPAETVFYLYREDRAFSEPVDGGDTEWAKMLHIFVAPLWSPPVFEYAICPVYTRPVFIRRRPVRRVGTTGFS